MSNEEEYERLRNYLLQAQDLVGQKLEPKEVGENEKDFLGIRDLRLVHTLLEIIISWGFYPYFLPGVGVPLSKRVKSGYTNHELFTSTEEETKRRISTQTLYDLYDLVSPLVDLISRSENVANAKNYTTVASILMTRHLSDLYAALLELAYVPPNEIEPNSYESNIEEAIPTSPGQLLSSRKKQQTGLPKEKRDKCARMFMWLFDRSDLQRAMESLMALLGTSSSLQPVPNWLRTICGRFLSRILLKPNGVAIVLEFTVGQVEQLQLTQLESISKLVLSVPQQMPSIESYYAIIAPQLLVLLEKEAIVSTINQAVTFIIGRIIARHSDLGKRYIVDQIVGKLVSAWNQQEYDSVSNDTLTTMDSVVVDEDALARLLSTMHRLMISGEPSPVVIQACLSSSVPCLYHLYQFTVQSKSGLREIVYDLLLTYFRITTTLDGIHELKRILLDRIDLSGERVAYFAPGPSGGVVVRLRRTRKVLAGNELPLNADVLVGFLEKMNNLELCALNDPLFIISMLLTLHLIMGMLDKLGPTILAKPTQIISFAINVIHAHVDMITPKEKERKLNNSHFPDITRIVSEEEREAFEEEESTVEDDIESLILAINLLRAVMHENEELDNKSVQLLKTCLEPLKKLERHPVELVQESVQEFLLAITSYLSAQIMSGRKQDQPSLEASKEKYREAMKSLQDDLLPIRAHGMGMLKEMALAKDPLVSSGDGLNQLLDIFIRLVQDEDSYIYLNAVKGLSALTDAYGNEIIKKLGDIYSDNQQKLDNRLRIGEALLQTVQRCGDALGKYVNTLVRPLETVLARHSEDSHLRVSALSILGIACQTCPVALSSQIAELIDWVLNILDFEKNAEFQIAATVLVLSLFRGLAQQTLYEYPTESLRRTYRSLRYIEEADSDELTRYQARVALSDLDSIMRNEIFKNQKKK
ncbi:hypothetical protein G6F57_001082 [Rhizopus arrhizus]|uniref:RNA polymerase II assembly factor Rtp1 C-terminal domain-containing protein n=1 Tax=Rhizopus oryzae TaxID=64495 RepID=A0A9P7BXI8_RHIOR|nr:hypothetical protein G6F23_005586 [Rhizopus arrhizus]KAG1413877.1 hypothetical protein G6F58_007253 [Rhizopus delemar]KAG0764131.1 hypothetical protein G6F24_005459 [Rhizopus arrhizus]KAG0788815.1 hypothetical protein G6F21_006946 [Rhizopus arrhizus]KAG0791897.1 hypothetical protein G6F22_006012 [Rhizopus arrhizus]